MKLSMTYNTTESQDALICKIAELKRRSPLRGFARSFFRHRIHACHRCLIDKALERMFEKSKKGIDWDAVKQ